jgi:hypothetical protein
VPFAVVFFCCGADEEDEGVGFVGAVTEDEGEGVVGGAAIAGAAATNNPKDKRRAKDERRTTGFLDLMGIDDSHASHGASNSGCGRRDLAFSGS